MYFLLILFFVSLFGIAFMVERKLILLKNGQIPQREEAVLRIPQFEEWKYLAVKNTKRYSYKALVVTIRFYVRSTNFLKNKYQEIKIKMANRRKNHSGDIAEEKQEISKFLKVISEYKHKIREIKHKIHEEEKGL